MDNLNDKRVSKKAIIFLVISIFVFLGVIAIATFAFVDKVSDVDNTIELKTKIPNADDYFSVTNNVSLSLNASNILLYSEDNLDNEESSFGNLTINLDFEKSMYCDYDIYYYDIGDKYLKTEADDGKIELELSAYNDVTGNKINVDYKDIINNEKYFIAHDSLYAEGKRVSQDWKFGMIFRNVNGDQDYHLNQNYNGYFKVENVNCYFRKLDYTFSKDYNYTGDMQKLDILKGGYYHIEAWGSQKDNIYGSYVSSYASFNEGDSLYINVGGMNDSDTFVATDNIGDYNQNKDRVLVLAGIDSYINNSNTLNGKIYASSDNTNCKSLNPVKKCTKENNGYVKITYVLDTNME